MLARATKIVRGLVVYADNMRKNFERLGGLPFSGGVLVALAKRGVPRQTAYSWVQRSAMRAWKGEEFRSLLAADPDVIRVLSPTDLDACFDLAKTLKAVDAIFARVIGS